MGRDNLTARRERILHEEAVTQQARDEKRRAKRITERKRKRKLVEQRRARLP